MADTPLCPLLMQRHAASMSNAETTPRGCMEQIRLGAECVGSRCAWWVEAVDRKYGACGMPTRQSKFADPARDVLGNPLR